MKNKKYWVLTSLVTLLPVLIGLLLWDRLPEQLPTHFGADGAADGWSGKAFAVFGLPLMMLAFHWILFAATLLDKQNRGHNRKVLDLVGLIFPAMSVLFGVVIYSLGLGRELNMARLMFPLLGLFFLAIGNWLPKIRQNTTLGIKLKWTLYNEENWNKTHRVAGFTWVICGLIFLVLGFVREGALVWLLPGTVVLMAGVPTVYSWRLAKRQQAAGTYTESEVSKRMKQHPAVKLISLVLVTVILIGTGIVMFTGEVTYTCTDAALVIEADYWEDLTVPYGQIDSMEYRDTTPDGSKEWGWSSARLMLGLFSGEELGTHTRYSYTGCDACIILRSGNDVLVLNAADEAQTRALYEVLVQEVGHEQ